MNEWVPASGGRPSFTQMRIGVDETGRRYVGISGQYAAYEPTATLAGLNPTAVDLQAFRDLFDLRSRTLPGQQIYFIRTDTGGPLRLVITYSPYQDRARDRGADLVRLTGALLPRLFIERFEEAEIDFLIYNANEQPGSTLIGGGSIRADRLRQATATAIYEQRLYLRTLDQEAYDFPTAGNFPEDVFFLFQEQSQVRLGGIPIPVQMPFLYGYNASEVAPVGPPVPVEGIRLQVERYSVAPSAPGTPTGQESQKRIFDDRERGGQLQLLEIPRYTRNGGEEVQGVANIPVPVILADLDGDWLVDGVPGFRLLHADQLEDPVSYRVILGMDHPFPASTPIVGPGNQLLPTAPGTGTPTTPGTGTPSPTLPETELPFPPEGGYFDGGPGDYRLTATASDTTPGKVDVTFSAVFPEGSTIDPGNISDPEFYGVGLFENNPVRLGIADRENRLAFFEPTLPAASGGGAGSPGTVRGLLNALPTRRVPATHSFTLKEPNLNTAVYPAIGTSLSTRDILILDPIFVPRNAGDLAKMTPSGLMAVQSSTRNRGTDLSWTLPTGPSPAGWTLTGFEARSRRQRRVTTTTQGSSTTTTTDYYEPVVAVSSATAVSLAYTAPTQTPGETADAWFQVRAVYQRDSDQARAVTPWTPETAKSSVPVVVGSLPTPTGFHIGPVFLGRETQSFRAFRLSEVVRGPSRPVGFGWVLPGRYTISDGYPEFLFPAVAGATSYEASAWIDMADWAAVWRTYTRAGGYLPSQIQEWSAAIPASQWWDQEAVPPTPVRRLTYSQRQQLNPYQTAADRGATGLIAQLPGPPEWNPAGGAGVYNRRPVWFWGVAFRTIGNNIGIFLDPSVHVSTFVPTSAGDIYTAAYGPTATFRVRARSDSAVSPWSTTFVKVERRGLPVFQAGRGGYPNRMNDVTYTVSLVSQDPSAA